MLLIWAMRGNQTQSKGKKYKYHTRYFCGKTNLLVKNVKNNLRYLLYGSGEIILFTFLKDISFLTFRAQVT